MPGSDNATDFADLVEAAGAFSAFEYAVTAAFIEIDDTGSVIIGGGVGFGEGGFGEGGFGGSDTFVFGPGTTPWTNITSP